MNLVTHQTGKSGQLVKKVFVTEAFDILEEYYAAITLDRNKEMDVFMVSSEGGIDIEKVAEKTPELIFTEEIDPAHGLQSFQARNVAFNLGLSGLAFKGMVKFITALYNAYVGADASLFEINNKITN